jgi:hypothetical protein
MSNLKIVNFEDFKSRWGLETDISSDFIRSYFNFFRDSLIELEDDGLITKYYISYNPYQFFRIPHSSNICDRVVIYPNLEGLDDKIEKVLNDILERATLYGKNTGKLFIYTTIFLPSSKINDITSILEKCIDCVNFLKDNGKDMEFDCNIKTHSPEGLSIELVKNL